MRFYVERVYSTKIKYLVVNLISKMNTKNSLIVIFSFVFSFVFCQEKTNEKEPNTVDFKTYFEKMERSNLAQEYRGIETDAGRETNLFSIKPTGISTESIQKAAKTFLRSLNPEQENRTIFPIEDKEWRMWSNVDNGIYKRQGVSIKEMDENQRKLAFDLMQVSLSLKGLKLSKDIMKTDQTLREYNNDDPAYDEELYYFTILGEPSETEPWGWQIDGHHLVINYFLLGDLVVMSPVFMGGEPIITTTGKYKGNTLFQDEQNLGLAFMQTLNKEQQDKATLNPNKDHNDLKASASKDNISLNYSGIAYSELTGEQQEALIHLAEQYINNLKEGHSQVKMEEIKSHLDDTWFAWVGNITADAVFYYRIHSPVVLIEFDHQGLVGMPKNGYDGPSRQHIHTMVRTPNGNDYGKDLLRQHKEIHHHEN